MCLSSCWNWKLIIEKINKEREIIKSKLAEVENTLEILNAKKIELTSIIDKLHQTEDKVSAVEKKVEELEAKLKERDNLIVKLLEKFENTSETFKTSWVECEVEIFKCNEYNLETKSERGLNIHKKPKHHQKTICDILIQQEKWKYTDTHIHILQRGKLDKLVRNVTLLVIQWRQ